MRMGIVVAPDNSNSTVHVVPCLQCTLSSAWQGNDYTKFHCHILTWKSVQFEEWEQIGQQNVMLFTNREQLCISGKLDPATKGPCSVPRSLRLPVVGSTPAHGGSRPRGPSPSKPEIRTIFLRRNKAQPVLVYESSAPAGRRWPKLRTPNTRVSPYRGLLNQIRTDFFRRASACCRTGHGMLSCPGKYRCCMLQTPLIL